MTLEDDILREIKPTESECKGILADAMELQRITEDHVRRMGVDAKVMFAGSIGKGTYLKEPDIDMFILFPKDTETKMMERLGLEIGMAVLNGEKNYAEHPYISGRFKGMDVDMVPCFDVDSATNIISSVDRTPFHARFILENSDDRMRDEMRLMKRFMKGIGAYGAEPHVRGFSGYLCEILTLFYGGFRKTLEAASQWKAGTVLDFGNGEGRFPQSPLAFHDPVDGKRNVASAVHLDTMSRFIVASNAYLKKPDRRFFFPVERTPYDLGTIRDRLQLRGTSLFSVIVDRPDALDDIINAQMWKTRCAIIKKLTLNDFVPIRSIHRTGADRLTFVFELAATELSETHLHIGPDVWSANSSGFLEVWSDNPYGAPFIEDGKWKVVSRRAHRTAMDLIDRERYNLGAGKNLDVSNMTIMDHDDTVARVDSTLLTELIDPRHPWEN